MPNPALRPIIPDEPARVRRRRSRTAAYLTFASVVSGTGIALGSLVCLAYLLPAGFDIRRFGDDWQVWATFLVAFTFVATCGVCLPISWDLHRKDRESAARTVANVPMWYFLVLGALLMISPLFGKHATECDIDDSGSGSYVVDHEGMVNPPPHAGSVFGKTDVLVKGKGKGKEFVFMTVLVAAPELNATIFDVSRPSLEQWQMGCTVHLSDANWHGGGQMARRNFTFVYDWREGRLRVGDLAVLAPEGGRHLFIVSRNGHLTHVELTDEWEQLPLPDEICHALERALKVDTQERFFRSQKNGLF